ncbi:hypothetical protein CRENBAI_003339 [Crenichthys baileyi]|uniref:Uncharacterized protein n=1 Tax=Crenichthys baileyi TaxID=28760 RepID=A0AAV9RKU9_9TELE
MERSLRSCLPPCCCRRWRRCLKGSRLAQASPGLVLGQNRTSVSPPAPVTSSTHRRRRHHQPPAAVASEQPSTSIAASAQPSSSPPVAAEFPAGFGSRTGRRRRRRAVVTGRVQMDASYSSMGVPSAMASPRLSSPELVGGHQAPSAVLQPPVQPPALNWVQARLEKMKEDFMKGRCCSFVLHLMDHPEDLDLVHSVLQAEFLAEGWLDAPVPVSAGGPFDHLLIAIKAAQSLKDPEPQPAAAGSSEPQPAAAGSSVPRLIPEEPVGRLPPLPRLIPEGPVGGLPPLPRLIPEGPVGGLPPLPRLIPEGPVGGLPPLPRLIPEGPVGGLPPLPRLIPEGPVGGLPPRPGPEHLLSFLWGVLRNSCLTPGQPLVTPSLTHYTPHYSLSPGQTHTGARHTPEPGTHRSQAHTGARHTPEPGTHRSQAHTGARHTPEPGTHRSLTPVLQGSCLDQSLHHACISVAAGLLDACISVAAGLLDACISVAAGLLDACISVAAGLLDACISVAAGLLDACISVAAGLLDACISASGSSAALPLARPRQSHSLSFPAAQFLTCYHLHLIAWFPLSLVHTPPPSVYKLVVCTIPHWFLMSSGLLWLEMDTSRLSMLRNPLLRASHQGLDLIIAQRGLSQERPIPHPPPGCLKMRGTVCRGKGGPGGGEADETEQELPSLKFSTETCQHGFPEITVFYPGEPKKSRCVLTLVSRDSSGREKVRESTTTPGAVENLLRIGPPGHNYRDPMKPARNGQGTIKSAEHWHPAHGQSDSGTQFFG